MILNYSAGDVEDLIRELKPHDSLRDVLSWLGCKSKLDVHPQLVAEVITQDEFTHDVIVPYRDLFLVYDTT